MIAVICTTICSASIVSPLGPFKSEYDDKGAYVKMLNKSTADWAKIEADLGDACCTVRDMFDAGSKKGFKRSP